MLPEVPGSLPRAERLIINTGPLITLARIDSLDVIGVFNVSWEPSNASVKAFNVPFKALNRSLKA